MSHVTFKQYAKEAGIEQGVYPHALFGLSVLKNSLTTLKWLAVVLALYFLTEYGLSDEIWDNADPSIFGESSRDTVAYVQELSYSALYYTNTALWYVRNALVLLFVTFCLVYFMTTIKRWRSYERECLANDFRAMSLRKKLVKAMHLKRRYSDAQKKTEGKSSNEVDLSTQVEIEVYKTLLELRVSVNTRESLDTSAINRVYQIQFDLPYDHDQYESIVQKTKSVNLIATRLTDGEVSFGESQISSDRLILSFVGSIIVPDKYARDTSHLKEQDDTVYEYSFPLSLFVDKTAEVDAKKADAAQWAERTGSALDNLFATKGDSVKRLSTVVGATNVAYEYETSFSLNLNGFESMAKNIDAVFKTKGSTVQIVEGRVQIVMPVPSMYSLPIDVAGMYREVFGSDKQAA